MESFLSVALVEFFPNLNFLASQKRIPLLFLNSKHVHINHSFADFSRVYLVQDQNVLALVESLMGIDISKRGGPSY